MTPGSGGELTRRFLRLMSAVGEVLTQPIVEIAIARKSESHPKVA
jgi:hypothetical protein